MATVERIPLGDNSVYLLEAAGERLCIDTGPDFRGASVAIDSALGGRAPAAVIATHGHLDHAGLGRWWQSKGVPVGLGAADRWLATGPHFADPAEHSAFARYVEECGAPVQVVAEVLDGLDRRREWASNAARGEGYPSPGRDSRWPGGLRYVPFEPDILFHGDGLCGAAGASVLSLPGHTPGNTVVLFEEEGWLFSGDQLLPGMTPTPAIQAKGPVTGTGWRFQSLPAFLHSLKRLAAMEFSRCFPGHGEPFDDVAAALETNISQIEQRSERVLTELREKGPATVYGLAERIYPRAVQRRFWQIIATVQGHLDILEAERRAGCDGNRYEAVP